MPERRNRTFLLWIFGNFFLFDCILYAIDHWFCHHGFLPIKVCDSTLPHLFQFFQPLVPEDSWGPMLKAVHAWQQYPNQSVYDSVFFIQQVKFQYPLTSLLAFLPLEHWRWSDAQIINLANGCGRIAFILTALVCALIARECYRATSRETKEKLPRAQAIAVLFAAICFFPLNTSCVFGQIQTMLILSYSIAFYCWLKGMERTAGVFIALMALVKPQYALLLLWAALRRRWGAFWTGMATAAAGLGTAVAVFGWKSNLDYFFVLRAIGRTGETFFMNQSMNGLLNRLFYPADSMIFNDNAFAPFNPAVYAGTIISSLLLIGIALVWPVRRAAQGRAADFAAIAAVSTLASPVAWTHHYGVFLPILTWLWFGCYRTAGNLRGKGWLAAAFVLLSNSLGVLVFFDRIPGLNLAESYVYAGGLITLGLLLYQMKSVDSLLAAGPDLSALRQAPSGVLYQRPQARVK